MVSLCFEDLRLKRAPSSSPSRFGSFYITCPDSEMNEGLVPKV
jgi:hypothetical protein